MSSKSGSSKPESSKPGSSTESGATGSAAGDPVAEGIEDAKAKMRAALRRKNAGDHPTAEGVRNTGPVDGSGAGADAKRTFQPRKTG